MTESVLDPQILDKPVTWRTLERVVDRLRSEIHGSRALPQDAERALPALLSRSVPESTLRARPENATAEQTEQLSAFAVAHKTRLAFNNATGRWEARS